MQSKIVNIGHKQNFEVTGNTVTATVTSPEHAIGVLNEVRKELQSFCTDITGIGTRGGLLVMHFRSAKAAKVASSLLKGRNLGGNSNPSNRVLHN